MASKGHRYEISNRKAVKDTIFRLWMNARERHLDQACEWITSRHFERYVTGEDFSYPLKPAHVLNAAEADEDCARIIEKIESGHEVRRFSASLFESKTPDFDHIFDWITEVKTTCPAEYAKLPRMTVPVVAHKAEKWTESLRKKIVSDGGRMKWLLAIDKHMSWYELTDYSALFYEGAMMSHCVGGSDYATRVNSGQTRIFSLRFNETKPLLTLEVTNSDGSLSLVQIQKKANGGLPVALCDAAIALLNWLGVYDFRNRSKHYGLVCEGRLWSSIYDRWIPGELFGRNVLSDGNQTLYMCSSDPRKPLVLVSVGQDRDGESILQVKAVTDTPPHYVDQIEACDILNCLTKEKANVSTPWIGWLRRHPETGLNVPSVDLFESRTINGVTFYVTDNGDGEGERYLFPHGADPARFLLEARRDRYFMRAKVCDAQTISRSQIARCLAFLNEIDVSYIGLRDDRGPEPETTQFKKTYDLVRVGERWRAFALDKRKRDAKWSDGIWEWSEYLVRYRGKGGHLDLFIDGGRVTGSHNFGLRTDDGRELTTSLNTFKLKGCATVKLEMAYGDAAPALLVMIDGKWVIIRTIKEADRYLVKLQAQKRKPRECREVIYASLLDYAAEIRSRLMKDGKDHCAAEELRNILLPLWFDEVSDFGKYQSRTPWLNYLGKHAPYPMTERLCDLHDGGYRPDMPKQVRQIKKALKDLISSYPRGRINFPHEEEFSEVAIRWYHYMPRPALNRISCAMVRFKKWEATRDAAAAYLQIMEDRELWGTRLEGAVRDRARRILGEQDLRNLPLERLKSHARLCDATTRGRWVYSSDIPPIETMLDILKHADLGEETDEFKQIDERLTAVLSASR
jgi:hypothetical protein